MANKFMSPLSKTLRAINKDRRLGRRITRRRLKRARRQRTRG